MIILYAHGGLSTPTASQHNVFDSEKLKIFLCSWRGSNIGSLDLESDALPIESPRWYGQKTAESAFGVHGYCKALRWALVFWTEVEQTTLAKVELKKCFVCVCARMCVCVCVFGGGGGGVTLFDMTFWFNGD